MSFPRPLVAASLPFVLLMSACGSSEKADASAPTVVAPQSPRDGVVVLDERSLAFVRVGAPEISNSLPLVRAPGHVVLLEGSVAEVGTGVTGRVSNIHVTLGSRVRRGDPLITLESPDAVSARAALRGAETTLRAARAELERSRRLAEQGIATERELLESERTAATAEAEAIRARAIVAMLGGGSGDRLVLRAPIEGVVLEQRTAVGSIVSPSGDAPVRIGDPDALWVEAEVFDRDVARLHTGGRARVLLGDGTAAPGTVVTVGAAARGASRTSIVRVALDAPTPGLRPGRFVRVELLSDQEGLRIPASSVVIRNGRETAVYIASSERPGAFERRTVTVGPSFDGFVSVLAGLGPSDRIVVEGALLVDGSADLLL